jgi:hypothetical protein
MQEAEDKIKLLLPCTQQMTQKAANKKKDIIMIRLVVKVTVAKASLLRTVLNEKIYT